MHKFVVKIVLSVVVVLALLIAYYVFPKRFIFTEQISSEIAQAAPTNGLVGYWTFDEGTGSEASDSSNHGNIAILNNGPEWTGGKFGGGIHLDGVDDLLRINPASFDFSGNITIATWIKQELTGGNNAQSTLIVSMDSEGARKFAVLLDRGNKRFIVQTTNIDSGTDFDTYTVVGSWFHFALTKSGTKARIYVNGSPIGGDFVVENATGNDIGIGRYTAVNSRGCNCSFDEFRVYGRALSAREVNALYNDTGVSSVSATKLK